MELYTKTAYEQAQLLTNRYSTSFSSSSRLFSKNIRPHIYAIYGFVRIADEIVDTHKGDDTLKMLNDLEAQAYELLGKSDHFSTNPITHAFADTAKQFKIDRELIKPFFDSMRTDIVKSNFNQEEYDQYIYGSAEVIGLMCLRVFCAGDNTLYKKLAPGARRLGSAYQKVNFLRDMRSDYDERGRVYFPGVDFESFSQTDKANIEADIQSDFEAAKKVIPQIPSSARRAIETSYAYYHTLLDEIKKQPASQLTERRIRVPDTKKIAIYIKKGILGL